MIAFFIHHRFKTVALLFGFLFWYLLSSGTPSINLFLVECALVAGIIIIYKPGRIDGFRAKILGAWFLSWLAVIFIHSDFAIFIHFLFFLPLCLLHVGHEKAYSAYALNTFLKFISWNTSTHKLAGSPGNVTVKSRKNITTVNVIFPLAIILIFFFLYSSSVPYFYSYFDRFFQKIGLLFKDFSWESFWWITAGVTCALLFWKNTPAKLISHSGPDQLTRKKVKKSNFPHLALLYENRMLTGLLLSLNLLLLLANTLDIRFIWFGNTEQSYDEAQWAVRYGTIALIIALLLSILISVYVFRKNQNFFTGNKNIKYLAYLWLFQNLIQVCSLCIRNIEYIEEFNLAYKRFGVFIFCIAVVFGLFSTAQKIYKLKSVSWLVRVNIHFILTLMLICSFFPWDQFIVRYNVNHPRAYQDMDFMCTRKSAALILLLESNSALDNKVQGRRNFEYLLDNYYGKTYRELINEQLEKQHEEYKRSDWRNWNYRDYSVFKKAESMPDLADNLPVQSQSK